MVEGQTDHLLGSRLTGCKVNYPWDAGTLKLVGALINRDTRKPEAVELVPMGCGEAKLRRRTIPR
jgi:hypothetical protein